MSTNKKTLLPANDLSSMRRPAIEDKPWADKLLSHSGYQGCEHTFGSAFIWAHFYGTRLMRVDDFLIVRGEKSFSLPAGRGDMEEILRLLHDGCEEQNRPFRLHGVTEAMIPVVEEALPGYFDFILSRDSSDYLYLSDNLIRLPGKKFHGKRNHISKFSREHNWAYEDMTADNLEECLEVGRLWCLERSEDCRTGKDPEFCALSRAIGHFHALDFAGGLIRVDGKAVAFTCGERLNRDTFVIHFEKTLPGWEGAYPVINNQFAKNRLSDYHYINREEDLGIEGLRKAKLSYHPDLLLQKYRAIPREIQ